MKDNNFKTLSELVGETTSLADSPCIGYCTTTQWRDKRCGGCGRTAKQVLTWESIPEIKRKLINIKNSAVGYPIRQKRQRMVAKRPVKPLQKILR